MAKHDPAEICSDIHRVLLTIVRGYGRDRHGAANEIFDMLGRLDPDDKQQLWVWLDQRDRNLKQWLMTQGNQRRAA
ncbi:hypothetical protein VB780_25880 [Leptolyngbya sp. CCNP1308]|uniref:hypothetical protein n=1 Tax=Leptolyngbya sp. CCNP1308 TaxID=3110255 RepID=UPI002B1FDF0D|nr:hypothetical protein [Leptolyngbya sp. CCNP1308]MEA5452030.1 hypothetical protein [Leptolyngbya sp. CCNP1308]